MQSKSRLLFIISACIALTLTSPNLLAAEPATSATTQNNTTQAKKTTDTTDQAKTKVDQPAKTVKNTQKSSQKSAKKPTVKSKRATYRGTPLRAAFQMALFTNPNILTSESRERAAYHALREAKAGYLPTIDLLFGIGRERSRPPAVAWASNTAQEESLNLTQTLFNGQRTSSEVGSAKAEYGRQAHLTDQEINDIALETTSTYLDNLRYIQLIAIARSNVASHIKTYSQMRERFQKGAGRKSEIQLARGRLARAKVTLVNAQGELRNAKATYIKIVGEDPSGLSMPNPPSAALPNTLKEAEKMAMLYNPQIAAAKKAYMGAQYAVKEAKSAFAPNVGLRLAATRNTNINGIQGRTVFLQGMVVANYNLFRGFADVNATKEAIDTMMADEHALQSTRREVIENVRIAWFNLMTAKQQLQQLYSHVAATRQVVAAYKEEFQIGKRSLLNVLDIENELFLSRADLVNGRFGVALDKYTVLADIGILPHFLSPVLGKNANLR